MEDHEIEIELAEQLQEQQEALLQVQAAMQLESEPDLELQQDGGCDPQLATDAPPQSASEDDGDDDEEDEDEDFEYAETDSSDGRRTAIALQNVVSSDDEDAHWGLGTNLDVLGHAREAAEAGPQTETAHFADWEQHSRGIASKLLARMGFIKGRGLGRNGEGISEPVPVAILHSKRGLGGDDPQLAVGKKKKKNRGGERARKKRIIADSKARIERNKHAELADELTHGAGLFGFINQHLGDQSEAAANIRKTDLSNLHSVRNDEPGSSSASAPAHRKRKQPLASRQSLAGQQDKVDGMKAQATHLKESMRRNKDNKILHGQLEIRLEQVHAALRHAEAEQSHMHKAIHDKESEKKWLKF